MFPNSYFHAFSVMNKVPCTHNNYNGCATHNNYNGCGTHNNYNGCGTMT